MIPFWGQSFIKFGQRDYKRNFEYVEFEMLLRQLSVGRQMRSPMELEHRGERNILSYIYIIYKIYIWNIYIIYIYNVYVRLPENIIQSKFKKEC